MSVLLRKAKVYLLCRLVISYLLLHLKIPECLLHWAMPHLAQLCSDLHRMSDRKNNDFSNRITACEGTECEGVITVFAREIETRKEMEVINPKF